MPSKILFGPSNHLGIQLIRYGFVLVVAFPIDFGLLYVFTSKLHIYYVLSAVISFSISMAANYFLSIAWVFTYDSGKTRRQEAAMFALIGFVGLGLTALFIWIFTSVFGVYYLISKFLAALIVFFWSFFARRHFVFGVTARAKL